MWDKTVIHFSTIGKNNKREKHVSSCHTATGSVGMTME
jgi:hypothetical protein